MKTNASKKPQPVAVQAGLLATSSKSVKHVSDAIMFDVIDSMIPSLAKKYREQFCGVGRKAA